MYDEDNKKIVSRFLVRADYSSLAVKQAKLIEDERISEQRVMKMEAQLRQ